MIQFGLRCARHLPLPLLFALCALALLFPAAGAESVALMEANVHEVWIGSAVWTGEEVFIMGGFSTYGGGHIGLIQRYDPEADTLHRMGATFPTGRSETSAIWDGRHVFVFGGKNFDEARDGTSEILRYDPVADRIDVMDARLLGQNRSTSAVYDGRYAYIFGGFDIQRYDPIADTLTFMNASLPGHPAAAAWDGEHAYLFYSTRGIVRYDPATDTVTAMNATLPGYRTRITAFWGDGHGYVIGGHGYAADGSGQQMLDEIVRFDPREDTAMVANVSLPGGRQGPIGVWAGAAGFVFGGNPHGYEIVRYAPTDLPDLAPTNGTAPGEAVDGDAVTFTARVANTGTGNASRFDVRFRVDNTSFDETVTVDALAAGEEVSVTSPAWTAREGAHTVTITVDARDALREFHETNNAVTLHILVQARLVEPAAPQNVTAAWLAPSDGVRVAWTPPEGADEARVTAYRVYRLDDEGRRTFVTESARSTPVTDGACGFPATCRYVVTAVNRAGESPGSEEATPAAVGVSYRPEGDPFAHRYRVTLRVVVLAETVGSEVAHEADEEVRVVFHSPDRDLVPDELEPTLCDVEDPDNRLDGQCHPSSDYERPSRYGIERELE